MKAMLYADWRSVRRSVKAILWVVLVMSVAASAFGGVMVVPFMLTMLSLMFPATLMNTDHAYGWDKLSLTLPVSRRDVVGSKFTVSLLVNLAAFALSTVLILIFSAFEKTLQATGRSLYSTIAQVAGALTNIVLDPIMIYGLLGCPKLGVEGAAWATVLGQIASLALAAVFHFRLNRELPFRRKALRLRRSIVGEIYSIGVPAIIAQGAMSVMNYCVNLIFGSLDSSYVTAYGIVYKIQQFVLFAVFGLRDAITPIVSFSYGMQNAKRIREGVRCGLMYTSVLMLVCTAAVEILAQPLAGIFSLSAGTMGLCVTGLRVLAVSFVFAGANIAIQGVFQATEGGVQSLLVSLLRQLIFVLPAAWLFARLLPADVWLAFPIAEVLTAVIAAVLLRHTAGKGRLSQQDHAASLSK